MNGMLKFTKTEPRTILRLADLASSFSFEGWRLLSMNHDIV